MPPSESRPVSVEWLADEYLDRLRRGESPSVDDYAARFPELADEIREFFPALKLVENFKPDRRDEVAAMKPAGGFGPFSHVAVPSRLGDFQILREVARGGMGVVYEALQQSLGRPVALKVLPPNLLADARHKKRFLREAKAAARLHHTNIVPVFGVGEADGVHFYAMQFINGLGLDKVLDELRRLRAGDVRTPADERQREAIEALPATKADESVARDTRMPDAASFAGGGSARFNRDASLADGGTCSITAEFISRSLMSGCFANVPPQGSGDSGAADSDGFTLRAPAHAVNEKTRRDAAAESSPSSRIPGDTGVGKLSDTAVYALPGQDESSSAAGGLATYWQSVARIGVQVGEALQYAHDHGVLHRDVKPSNLLLDARGSAWVTDFGLAKADDQDDLTKTGDVIGTLRYMAPELFNGKADARSDVYSLGLTLYELLALRPAFDETNRHTLIRTVMHDSPPALRTLAHKVPRDLAIIVHKAIDRDPGHRYQTAGELAADLERFLADQPIKARRISYIARLRRWCKRNKAVASLVGTISALVIVAAVVSGLAAAWFKELADTNQKLADDKATALDDANHRLFDSLLAEARSSRWSGRPGQRFDAMRAIDRASKLVGPLGLGDEARAALRDETIAASSLVDVKRIRSLDGPLHTNWEVVFSPDLSLYTRLDDTKRTIYVRSTAEPDSDRLILRYTNKYSHCRFSPDNRHLVVTGSNPASVTVFDLKARKRMFSLELPGWYVCGDISPDGRFLALGRFDEKVVIYELKTGKLVATHRVSVIKDHIRRVRYSPDGRKIAVGRPNSGNVEILDVKTGKTNFRLSLGGDGALWSIAWGPKGRWLAVGGWKRILLWDLRQPDRPPINVPGHESAVDYLQFHSSGDVFGSTSWDGTSRIWEAATGYQLLQLEEKFPHFSADGRKMATWKGLKVHFWEVAVPEGIKWIYGNQSAHSVDVDATGRLLALSFAEGVRFYDLATHREVAFIPMEMRNCGLLFHPVTGSLITANARGVLEWPVRVSVAGDRREYKIGPARPLDSKFHQSREVKTSRDGATVMARSARYSAAYISSTKGDSRKVLRVAKRGMRWISLSPDGEWAAAGNWGGDGDVAVWSARTGKQVRRLPVPGNAAAFFSLDNRWLVTNGGDAARFWEVGTWRERYSLPANVVVPSPVGFTGDSRIAVVCRRGIGLHLLDLRTGKILAQLATNQRRPHFESLYVSPDGGTIVAGRGDAGVCVWDLRAIRRRLKAMGLDWDAPAIPDKPVGKHGTQALDVIVDLGILKPEPTAESILREARAHARRGQWPAATEDYLRALKTGVDNPDNLFEIAAGLLIGGEKNRSREICRGLLKRFASTKNGRTAYLVARATALARDARIDPAAGKLASLAVRSDSKCPWYLHIRGLVAYREGRFDSAVGDFETSARSSWEANIANWIGLALAHHRLGHTESAQRYWQKARQWLAKTKPLHEQDVVAVKLLRDEAEEVFSKRKSVAAVKPRK